LIVLMAQVGSFVPAESARIGLVDRIFTRIGAQDDLAAGASTFLVEMMETAAILRHATPRSLIVLDEVGRGTGTDDGVAIARAVVEDLVGRVQARTLFATHYHDLAEESGRLPGVQVASAAVAEEDGDVTFLHRITPGAMGKSYGIHVARLAGLPPHVVERARELLNRMPPRGHPAENAERARRRVNNGIGNGHEDASAQPLSSVLSPQSSVLLNDLMALDLARMTPLEAIAVLGRLQDRARAMPHHDGQNAYNGRDWATRHE
jgi:DNA mismatch repair protein MutS